MEGIHGSGSLASAQDEISSPTKRTKDSTNHASNTPKGPAPDATRNPEVAPVHSDDEETTGEMDLRTAMQREKQRYPGASTWAEDEEKLFEVLFLRQDVPLLPSHWDVDFRGVPISETVFNTSDEDPPVVFAHSDKEFQATQALMRLIDVTSTVRATAQSGLRHKVPGLIKKSLDQLLGWAAADGDYDHLRIVPNIITEVIDTKSLQAAHITEYIQCRMKALATLQQQFLRKDRHPRFWEVVEPWVMNPENSLHPILVQKVKRVYRKLTTPAKKHSPPDEQTLTARGSPSKKAAPESQVGRKAKRSASAMDELAGGYDENKAKRAKPDTLDDKKDDPLTSPTTPKRHAAERDRLARQLAKDMSPDVKPYRSPPRLRFSRTPPVVYGLFIINTSVFLLTADSRQGADAYVSFHVEMNFFDRHQSVWNALTVAIAVCMARDELMTRKVDFDVLPEVEDSDPDA